MVIYRQIGRDALYKIWNKAQENMIICFHSGTGSIVFQDAIYPIEPSAICFVRAGKLHYTMPDNFENYNRSKIFLSDRRMSALLSSLPEGSSFYKLFLENCFNSLTSEEKLFLKYRYYDEKSQLEISKLMNVSQMKISRMEKKVLSVLKNMYYE